MTYFVRHPLRRALSTSEKQGISSGSADQRGRTPLLRRALAYTALAISILVLALPARGGSHAPGQLSWSSNINQAWQIAQSTHRPLLVYASMEGCHYCRLLERETLSDPSIVAEIQRLFVTASANVSENPDFVRRLAVRSFPTLVIIDTNGYVLDSIRGYVPPQQLRARLESVVKRR